MICSSCNEIKEKMGVWLGKPKCFDCIREITERSREINLMSGVHGV